MTLTGRYFQTISIFSIYTGRENKMEQRIVITFKAKSGVNAVKTYKSLRNIYGDECLARSKVFKWHKRFRGGRESVKDYEREPKPRTTRCQ